MGDRGWGMGDGQWVNVPSPKKKLLLKPDAFFKIAGEEEVSIPLHPIEYKGPALVL